MYNIYFVFKCIFNKYYVYFLVLEFGGLLNVRVIIDFIDGGGNVLVVISFVIG